MRVTLPTMYNSVVRDLQRLAVEMQQINESISSGKKYNAIYQNPLDVQRAMGYQNNIDLIDQYQRNLQTAESWLTNSEATLQNIGDILKEAMTLAEQMATGTYDADNRAAAAKQVRNILEEVVQEGNVDINGQYLLSGYKTDTPPFVWGNLAVQAAALSQTATSSFTGTATSGGTYTDTTARTYLAEVTSGGAVGTARFRVSDDGGQTWSAEFTTGAAQAIWGNDGVDRGVTLAFAGAGDLAVGDRIVVQVSPVTYQGDDNTVEVAVSKTNRLAINSVGRDVVGGSSGGVDIFQVLYNLQTALENNDQATVSQCLEDLEAVNSNILQYQGDFGARSQRVTYKQNAYASLKDRLTAGLSAVADTDLITATTDLNLVQTAYEAALYSSTQVLNLSLLDYMS